MHRGMQEFIVLVNVDRSMISDVVGDWDTVSFLTTLSGRGVAQGLS